MMNKAPYALILALVGTIFIAEGGDFMPSSKFHISEKFTFSCASKLLLTSK